LVRDAIAIDVRVQDFWSDFRELQFVANVIKHGEGWSADELRKINPALFYHPGTPHDFIDDLIDDFDPPHLPVAAPLAGGDLYVTEQDYRRYVEAPTALWNWMAAQLHDKRFLIPPPS
jgi:hypothetical protein